MAKGIGINRLKTHKSKTKFLEFRFKNKVRGNRSNYSVRLGDQFIKI